MAGFMQTVSAMLRTGSVQMTQRKKGVQTHAQQRGHREGRQKEYGGELAQAGIHGRRDGATVWAQKAIRPNVKVLPKSPRVKVGREGFAGMRACGHGVPIVEGKAELRLAS